MITCEHNITQATDRGANYRSGEAENEDKINPPQLGSHPVTSQAPSGFNIYEEATALPPSPTPFRGPSGDYMGKENDERGDELKNEAVEAEHEDREDKSMNGGEDRTMVHLARG